MSENTINIYMGAEDKVNVKDNTQIIKLQGPKGDPGPKGKDGVQGPKGEPFKYSDFTSEQLELLKGPKGDAGENGAQGVPGPQGDNVNLGVVKKLKDLLLDHNMFVKSDSLEGIMFEYFKAQIAGLNFNNDADLPVPDIQIHDGVLEIYYVPTLPFQVNDGEIQYMKAGIVEVPLPSTTENTTIKFYNARMKLMHTKLIEVTL